MKETEPGQVPTVTGDLGGLEVAYYSKNHAYSLHHSRALSDRISTSSLLAGEQRGQRDNQYALTEQSRLRTVRACNIWGYRVGPSSQRSTAPECRHGRLLWAHIR